MNHKIETKSLWLGFFAVSCFALTLPMSKWALGASPHSVEGVFVGGFNPWFIAFGRAAVAGILSVIYLLYTKSARPTGAQWGMLAAMAAGNVFGFPIFQTIGLQYVSSSNAAVFNGILPLMTAAMSAFLFRQKPSFAFWFFAALGGFLVITFAVLRTGSLNFHWGDALIFTAVTLCAMGYAFGAKASQTMPPPQVLCWSLVISLPISVPAFALTLPAIDPSTISTTAWFGFAYLCSVSMWFGMMVWFYALNLGGAVRDSQVQLVQVFLAILFSVPLLGESIDVVTIVFAIAVVAVAFIGKKMPTNRILPTRT